MAKITGKTKTGFAFSIDEEARDDMEMLESIIAIEKGAYTAVPDVVISLLGKEQKAKLYEHCRNKKTGRVLASKVFAEIENIFNAIQEGESATKNS